MTGPKILVSEPSQNDRPSPAPMSDFAWRVLGAIGLAFAIVGGLDVALVWYPPSFGSPEWEFGTVTASLDGLPLPVLGLSLVLASAVARGASRRVRVVALLFVALAVLILAGGIVYLTDVPIALQSVRQQPLAHLGVMKSMVKTAVQVVAYPLTFIWIGRKAWGQARTTSQAR